MMPRMSHATAAQRETIHEDPGQTLELFEECRTMGELRYRRFRDQARVNERIASGNLDPDPSIRTNTSLNMDHAPQAPQAILNNLCLTWAALITRERASVHAIPARKDMEAQAAAEIATNIIEHEEIVQDLAHKWHTVALWAAYHGTAWMNITPVEGGTRWRPLSITDVTVSDQEEPEDRQWCLTREWIDPWVALDLLRSEDPDRQDPPSTEDYPDGWGVIHQGVAKWSLWHRPSPRYPNGLYACIVADTVVESTVYPYVWDEGDKSTSLLPVIGITCRRNRGSPLGLTWASDCAPLQVALNQLNSKLLRNARIAQSYLVLPKGFQSNEGFDPQNQTISLDPGVNTGDIKWINPAPVDPNQVDQRTGLIRSMYDTAGISEQTAGGGSASSGRALAYQAELDAQKHADSFKALEVAVQAAWTLDLKLRQKYITLPQQLLLDNGTEVMYTGADISGISIRLEPRSQRDGSHNRKRELQTEQVMSGLASPDTLQSMDGGIATQVGRRTVQDIIDRYMRGEDVQLSPEIAPPDLVLQVIDERLRLSLLQRDIQGAEALQALKEAYIRSLGAGGEPPPQGVEETPAEDPSLAPLPESLDETPLPPVPPT